MSKKIFGYWPFFVTFVQNDFYEKTLATFINIVGCNAFLY